MTMISESNRVTEVSQQKDIRAEFFVIQDESKVTVAIVYA